MNEELIGQTLTAENADALMGEAVLMVVSLPDLTIVDVTDEWPGMVAAQVDVETREVLQFHTDPCNLPNCTAPTQEWVLVSAYGAMQHRIDAEPELEAHRETIETDWPEGVEHYEWAATAPIAEIVDWAETVERA